MKARYAYLDGIRGIAAIFVLVRHTPDFWSFSFFRSYLAVDLFFLMSGFVISSSYGKKLATGELSISSFFAVRLIRIYPMFLISLAVAIPTFAYITSPNLTEAQPLVLAEIALLTVLMLPSHPRPGGELFPLNGPYWSLFFEMIMSALYPFVRPLLAKQYFPHALALAGIVLAVGTYKQGNMDFGFKWGALSITMGFLRAGFGIFLGAYIQTRVQEINLKPRPLIAIGLICAALCFPLISHANFLIDLIIAMLVFPICILLAAKKESGRLASFMLFLGAASYPLYVLHKPIRQIVESFMGGEIEQFAPYSGLIFLLLLVPLAVWLEKKVDEPIRKYLASFKRQPKQPAYQRQSGQQQ